MIATIPGAVCRLKPGTTGRPAVEVPIDINAERFLANRQSWRLVLQLTSPEAVCLRFLPHVRVSATLENTHRDNEPSRQDRVGPRAPRRSRLGGCLRHRRGDRPLRVSCSRTHACARRTRSSRRAACIRVGACICLWNDLHPRLGCRELLAVCRGARVLWHTVTHSIAQRSFHLGTLCRGAGQPSRRISNHLRSVCCA